MNTSTNTKAHFEFLPNNVVRIITPTKMMFGEVTNDVHVVKGNTVEDAYKDLTNELTLATERNAVATVKTIKRMLAFIG